MSIVDCVVRNISASGAKLALAGSLPIPGEFELQIPQKGCSVPAWRGVLAKALASNSSPLMSRSQPKHACARSKKRMRN
jgi:hypothetical protein